MSSAGRAGEVRGDDEVGAGLAEAGARVDDGADELDVVFELLLLSAITEIASTVITAAATPATHHGQRRRRGGRGYPPGGTPIAPAG